MIPYYKALASGKDYDEFVASYPEGLDVDRITPILLNIAQVDVLKKQFVSMIKVNNVFHVPYMFRVGHEFKENNVHYLLTTLWAVQKDRAILKAYDRDQAVISSWKNSKDKQEIIKNKTTLTIYPIEEQYKCAYMPNKVYTSKGIHVMRMKSEKDYKLPKGVTL